MSANVETETISAAFEKQVGRKLTTQDLAVALSTLARESRLTSLEMWGSDWKVTVRIKKPKVAR